MIEWAITSSVLILVVLVLRRLLRGKISLRLQYGLWALVLLRLLLPISFGATAVSVLNLVDQAPIQTARRRGIGGTKSWYCPWPSPAWARRFPGGRRRTRRQGKQRGLPGCPVGMGSCAATRPR